MNHYRMIARLTGVLLIYFAGSMALPLAVSVLTYDGMQFGLLFAALLILMAGLLLRNMLGRDARYEIRGNDSIWVALAAWIAIPVAGTLPYLFTGTLGSFTDAVFESFSGFTTTGSSIVAQPEALPPSLLVYRAFTQWVGGLGLMLFIVAILRKLGIGAWSLVEVEFSGTQQPKLHPHLWSSVRRLWMIYCFLTLLLVVLLRLTGTGRIDSLCIAFSTISTGGFVPHSQGLAMLGNGSLIVVALFMLLSGINVALLFRLITFRWRRLWRDEELRLFLTLFVMVSLCCTLAFHQAGNAWDTSLRYSLFHVASTMSTTGFYLPRPAYWSFWVSVVTFLLIVIGASAGSTGGGIKLRRVAILVKYIYNYITRMMHPNAVFRVKMDGQVVENNYINKIFAFVFLYIASIAIGAFVLTICGCTIPDATCMAAANIGNLGPSPLINNLGGSLDYSTLPSLGKWTLTLLMLSGRLEIFAVAAALRCLWQVKS